MKGHKVIKIYVIENGYGVCPVGYGIDFPRMAFKTLTEMCDHLPEILANPEENIMEPKKKCTC